MKTTIHTASVIPQAHHRMSRGPDQCGEANPWIEGIWIIVAMLMSWGCRGCRSPRRYAGNSFAGPYNNTDARRAERPAIWRMGADIGRA
jgi:hypothetical protein